jgi:hypothetical protein
MIILRLMVPRSWYSESTLRLESTIVAPNKTRLWCPARAYHGAYVHVREAALLLSYHPRTHYPAPNDSWGIAST